MSALQITEMECAAQEQPHPTGSGENPLRRALNPAPPARFLLDSASARAHGSEEMGPREQARKERRERAQRADQWRLFRKNHLFTQRDLAKLLDISRRTLQQIEGGHVSPHPQTLRRFLVFQTRYNLEDDLRRGG